MKMVSIIGGEIRSFAIPESMIFDLFEDPNNVRVPTKSPYELIRIKNHQKCELIIVYQENKRTRSRNDWLEKRALSQLATRCPQLVPIKRNMRFSMNDVETEVDGVFEDVVIEIKGRLVDKKTLLFLEEKQKKLGFRELIVIAKGFKVGNCQPTTTLFTFHPDRQRLQHYYLDEITFPKFVIDHLGKRHVRYLKDNGHWTSQNHRYTKTAKWDVIDKFRNDITKIGKRSHPIKIYWSLSAMTGPLDEFRGQGYPIHRYLAAFDIDGSHVGSCIIDQSPICESCMDDAKPKLIRVHQKLDELNYQYRTFSSGSKGYHVYLFEDDQVRIFDQKQMEDVINYLIPDVDPFLSKNTGEFDAHRIFKIPHTVDASTGRIVKETHKALEFNDQLKEYLPS